MAASSAVLFDASGSFRLDRQSSPFNVFFPICAVMFWFVYICTVTIIFDFLPFIQGIFPESSVVLAEGWYDEDAAVFRATGIGLPPVERAVDTRRYFTVTNPFGGGQGIEGPTASLDKRMSRLLSASPVSFLSLLK